VESLEGRALLATVTVHVFNNDFSANPKGQAIVDPTIQVGDTVHWVWDEGFHDVRSVNGSAEAFDSGAPTTGATFDHTFTKAGTFTYYCSVHGNDNGNGTASGMAGTITVSAGPAASPLVMMHQVQLVTGSKRKVSQIIVNFNGGLNAGEAGNVSFYRLATAGKKGSFDAKNSKLIRLSSVAYDGVNNKVTLLAKKPFALSKAVQLRVNGLAPSGLHDSQGRLIDGDHDGQPGGNAIAVITKQGVTLS